MPRTLLLLTVPALLLAGSCLAQTIEVPLDEGWGACPAWCPADRAEQYDRVYRDGCATHTAEGGGRTMIWVRNPLPRLDVSRMGFVSMRYRLTGTDAALPSYLLYLDTGDSGGMFARNLIFAAGDLIHDGQWHTATTTLYPFKEIGTMALRIRALEERQGRLDVAYLRFSATPPRPALGESLKLHPGADGLVTEPVAVPPDSTVAAVQEALGLGDWFPAAAMVVEGVDFTVPVSGPAALTSGTEAREEKAIPVGRSARALYLLLGANFPYKLLGYSGWAPGDFTDRPEQVHFTLRYVDGTVCEQVPYCLNTRRYGVWRGLNAYALTADPGKQMRELVLHDGMRTSGFSLVALATGQHAPTPAAPGYVLHTPPGLALKPAEPQLRREGEELIARLPAGEVRLGLRPGLHLRGLSNRRNPQSGLQVRQQPLLAVVEVGAAWPAEAFAVTGTQVRGREAQVTLRAPAQQAEAVVTLTAGEQLLLRLQLRNLADRPRTLVVTFPQVQVTGREPADLWYFYPGMSAVWSNRDLRLDQAYSGYNPIQLMDVYDRSRGGGLTVATRDRDLRQRYFGLSARQGQVALKVQYRDNPPLGAGETVTYPLTVLDLHGGDWREAFRSYQRWFASWYRPSHPRPDWYRQVWSFRTWWTHTMGDQRPEWNLLDVKTGEYQLDRFLARDREQFGEVDMVHFFDWRWTRKYGLWGDYSHYEEELGGLDKFRGMIRSLQQQQVRVGLYLDAYLVSRKSDLGKAHGADWVLYRSDGRPGDTYSEPDDPMYNMCVAHEGYQDYLAQACARVARETGCDGIYLDEGMTDYAAYWCYRPEHGHPVPATNQPGLLGLCRKVRQALPAHVAFYTEWLPADAFVPYLDGAYQASLHHSDPTVSPGFVQTGRFAFPDLRVFLISNGGSMYDAIWEGVKYNVFNGAPLYSLSWGHDPEVLPLYRKLSDLLHKHGDTFNTAHPVPYRETERTEVFCNEFPATRETIWTLFNGRYQTLTAPVLAVPHVPGGRYYDLWNGGELRPKVTGRTALLTATLGPRGLGVISQVRPR